VTATFLTPAEQDLRLVKEVKQTDHMTKKNKDILKVVFFRKIKKKCKMIRIEQFGFKVLNELHNLIGH